MSLNPRVRQTAFAAAFLGASLLPMFSASAQEVLAGNKCYDAKAVAMATMQQNVSAAFRRSLAQFGLSCDLKTKFDTIPGTADDKVWQDFIVKINAIKLSRTNKPADLAAR
jgi:hypothetical protein